MSFLYPSFLWALTALSIPIIIHIFNFRRLKKVYFTNVRFLKELKTETNSFKTLRELLILLMRLGLVASLVLAFAQPFLPNENQKTLYNAGSIASIYLDNSYSMQNELARRKYLSWAKESISDLVKIFPKSAQFQLVTNDFRNREQFAINATRVEDILSETNFSPHTRDLQSVYARQQALLKRLASDERNQIFWFSDFQKSTLGNLEKLSLDSTTQFILVPLKSEQKANLYIDSAWLANPFVKANETNNLLFSVKNDSETPVQDLVARLFIEDLQVSTTTLDIGANGKVTGSFNFVTQERGTRKGKIIIEDQPITFDNEYFFTLNVAPTIRISYVYAGGGNPFVRSVYASEKSFNLVSYDLNTFHYDILPNTDLLILDGLPNLPAKMREELQKFTQNGGSVLIFPNNSPDIASYAEVLGSLGVRGLQAEKVDSLGKNSVKTLLPPNINNPFYEGVFEQNPKNADMPYANAVMSWLGVSTQLLGFKNGKSFLSEFRNGRGKLYLCASPLDKRYTDFPVNALFVPIMYKIAARSLEQNEKIAYNFQEKVITLKVGKSNKTQVFKLKNHKTEFVPAQRMSGEQLIIELPEETIEAGHYEVINGDNQVVGALAFNYDKRESVMQFYSLDELKKVFAGKKNVQIYENIADKKFIQDFQERNIGTSLWKYFVWLALFFLLAEILIIRLFKKWRKDKKSEALVS
jgi:hypothetical protein